MYGTAKTPACRRHDFSLHFLVKLSITAVKDIERDKVEFPRKISMLLPPGGLKPGFFYRQTIPLGNPKSTTYKPVANIDSFSKDKLGAGTVKVTGIYRYAPSHHSYSAAPRAPLRPGHPLSPSSSSTRPSGPSTTPSVPSATSSRSAHSRPAVARLRSPSVRF